MLNVMAPLSEVMEVFHSEAEEVSSELVAKAVEDAITLIGNASSQMSSLQRTLVLQVLCRGLWYSRSIIETWWIGSNNVNQSSMKLHKPCLDQTSPGR